MTYSIYCNSRIWIINHKHLKKKLSLFMQARVNKDLYDTSRMIKVDVDGFQGISMVNTILGCHRELADTSWDFEKKY